MKAPRASEFPVLRRVLTGYLHEDFLQDYRGPEEALHAFIDEADPDERRAFRDEARRFIERVAPLDFDGVRTLLSRLGCRWAPDSREAVVALLTGAADAAFD